MFGDHSKTVALEQKVWYNGFTCWKMPLANGQVGRFGAVDKKGAAWDARKLG
ncbi:MAG TPA: hypothetical protein H9687_03120 [Firmicutes bacterium]|nr:hypothetical protein [Bacillota bacterium]